MYLSRKLNDFSRVVKIACGANIVFASLRIAIVVGIVLNLINQGGALLNLEKINGFHLLLNFVVPYSVASYSAARYQLQNDSEAS